MGVGGGLEQGEGGGGGGLCWKLRCFVFRLRPFFLKWLNGL